MEYLVTMTTHVLERTPEQAVDDIRARPGHALAREPAAQRHLPRLADGDLGREVSPGPRPR